MGRQDGEGRGRKDGEVKMNVRTGESDGDGSSKVEGNERCRGDIKRERIRRKEREECKVGEEGG